MNHRESIIYTAMASRSRDTEGPVYRIRILVVDDDSTCLNVVSAMLQGWNYEVIEVQNPLEALSILRENQGQVHLVITDYHMPVMNGLELQKKVIAEFKLPVIMMSADNRNCIIVQSLQAGAVLFMAKPIHPEELKNVWQFTITGKHNQVPRPIHGEPLRIAGAGTSSLGNPQDRAGWDARSAASIRHLIGKGGSPNNDNPNQNPRMYRHGSNKHLQVQKMKFKAQMKDEKNKGKQMAPGQRKIKVVWTAALHQRFLLALSIVGIDKAVPKRILDLMNVPGLRRENVASHLQKYRIFLKQYEESAALWHTPVTGFPSMLGNVPGTSQEMLNITIPRPLEMFQPDYSGTSSIHDYYNNHRSTLFPSKPPLRYSILSKLGYLDKPTSSLYQPGSALVTNSMNQINGLSRGNCAPGGSGQSSQTVENMRRMYQQASLLAPKRYASRPLNYGLGAGNAGSGINGGTRPASAYFSGPPSLSVPMGNINNVGSQLPVNANLIGKEQAQPYADGAGVNGIEAEGFGLIADNAPPCTEKSTPTGEGTSKKNLITPWEPPTSTFWPINPSEEGLITGTDNQGIDALEGEENLFDIDEMAKNILEISDDDFDQLIANQGSLNSLNLEQVMNLESAFPTQKGPHQVEVNAQGKEVVNSEVYGLLNGGGSSNNHNLEQAMNLESIFPTRNGPHQVEVNAQVKEVVNSEVYGLLNGGGSSNNLNLEEAMNLESIFPTQNGPHQVEVNAQGKEVVNSEVYGLLNGGGSSNNLNLEQVMNLESIFPTQNGPHQVEVNAQGKGVVNSEVYGLLNGEGNSLAWNEPSLEQTQNGPHQVEVNAQGKEVVNSGVYGLLNGEGSSSAWNEPSLEPTQSGLHQVEVNAQGKEVVNSEVYGLHNGEGSSLAWNEPSLEQYMDFDDNEIVNLYSGFFPGIDENPNLLVNSVFQEIGTGNMSNDATNNIIQPAMNLATNASDEKEVDDTFIESLLNEVLPFIYDE